ncbi:cell division protein ZapA [Orbus hercynius]|uniref:Cell division protein ZapA n=1 Tax=Orbus hercynius TaxID=593135 RepID=A0A495RDA1_9GAMM|nr:cell division protein ZapA [Orbus hercynius]RKS85194.1 cell division protein ZapA [Orbus hercynius]
MSTQVVNIHVFGRTLKLSCPVDEVEALNLAAKDLDDRLNELRRKTQIMNSDQLIITAALNISYELTKEKLNHGQIDNDLNERLKNLQQQLDNALKCID